jgi:hypothetical protein
MTKKKGEVVVVQRVVTPPVSKETLDTIPGRALAFLRAVGTTPAIRAALATKGYEDADHAEGWVLLHTASGFSSSAPLGVIVDVTVRDAIVELDALDEDLFRTVRAALTRLHPAAGAFVLDGLGPSTGAAAVVGVKELLDRLDALESSPDRKATRADDKGALATLKKRGVDDAERARLRALVDRAEAPASAPATPDDAAVQEQQRLSALIALYAWFADWSETAKTVVKRRDYLIRLGFAAEPGLSSDARSTLRHGRPPCDTRLEPPTRPGASD